MKNVDKIYQDFINSRFHAKAICVLIGSVVNFQPTDEQEVAELLQNSKKWQQFQSTTHNPHSLV